ncbi:hypothetical protein D3C76_637540 [compost metagenome]
MLISKTCFQIYDVTFQNTAQFSTLRQPNWQTLSYQLIKCEDFQLFTQLTVIAFLRFFKQTKMLIELRFFNPSCTVYALKHFILAIAAPVSTGYIHQFKDFDLGSRRNVWPAAQVEEFTLFIDRNHTIFRQRFNQFKLVRIA